MSTTLTPPEEALGWDAVPAAVLLARLSEVLDNIDELRAQAAGLIAHLERTGGTEEHAQCPPRSGWHRRSGSPRLRLTGW